ncbi:MAG TPA: hypothetical protein VK904_06910 [Miltoncostaeaceae bacterium]|nr:hypothetical protein [Miltoncostaeaceae bacterium]
MAVSGPRRRRTDAGRDRPPAFEPSPDGLGPADPDALLRSLGGALESARRQRRAMTLVCLSVEPGDPTALERVAALTRRTVRETDAIWRDGERGIVLLLADADGPRSEPALARLRLRLRGRGMPEVMMGRAAPPPGIGAEELLLLARADRRPIGDA